jgi:hypothetical protein
MNYLTEIARRIRAAVPPSLVPEDSDDLFLLYAVLAESQGVKTSTEDVHNAWTAWKILHGEDHQSMVPFSELPPDVKAEDEPFAEAIRKVAAVGEGERKPEG